MTTDQVSNRSKNQSRSRLPNYEVWSSVSGNLMATPTTRRGLLKALGDGVGVTAGIYFGDELQMVFAPENIDWLIVELRRLEAIETDYKRD